MAAKIEDRRRPAFIRKFNRRGEEYLVPCHIRMVLPMGKRASVELHGGIIRVVNLSDLVSPQERDLHNIILAAVVSVFFVAVVVAILAVIVGQFR
jgi:5,10-methylene-tetrahydrofolate dehydrogenase/methenyl tetrahydrofolate cyclohydrolase